MKMKNILQRVRNHCQLMFEPNWSMYVMKNCPTSSASPTSTYWSHGRLLRALETFRRFSFLAKNKHEQ